MWEIIVIRNGEHLFATRPYAYFDAMKALKDIHSKFKRVDGYEIIVNEREESAQQHDAESILIAYAATYKRGEK